MMSWGGKLDCQRGAELAVIISYSASVTWVEQLGNLRNHGGNDNDNELMNSTMAVNMRYNSWYISWLSSADK